MLHEDDPKPVREGDWPQISIITPSLNQGRFIEQTILSVLAQDYPNLDYAVVDGGSSDNTSEILKKYSAGIRWVSERDNGQTHAINKGLRSASGSIVGYLNADDLLMSGALWKIAETFVKNPNVMWITGQCYIVDEANNVIRRSITTYKNTLLRLRNLPLLLMTNYISQPATFWRKKLLDEVGFFDEGLRYVMDYDYWLRLYAKYRPFLIPSYLAAFKIHGESKTTSTGHKLVYVNEERVVLQRYTRSNLTLSIHDAHRRLMTSVYSLINKGNLGQ